jgi:hypothetical protein
VGWLAVSYLTVPPARAIYLDDARTLFVTGVFYNQLRLRTQEPQGFNTKVADWTMMQHRYFIDPQLQVQVLPWLQHFSVSAQLAEALRLHDARFFFNPRFEYDGVYDYGPDVFRDELAPRLQKGNRLRLFEVYGDLSFFSGQFNLRAGRQNLSWGETDSFRLLDRINPLDNGFGGFLVPLDERRIPLTIFRATLGLGDYPEWEVYNTALEAFIAPDKALPKGPPGPSPWGVIGAPSPPGFPPTLTENLASLASQGRPFRGNQLDRPDLSLEDSRWGVRLLWTWYDISFTLAHMSTYPDSSTPSLQLNRQGDPIIKLRFPNIQITGLTATAPIPGTYAVFRTEVGGFFNEPFFIEEVNYTVGKRIPKRDVVRAVIGLDNNQWIRALNPRQTFFMTGQFFWTNVQGSMTGIKAPLQSRPGRFIDVDRNNFINTLSVNTLYPGIPLYFTQVQNQPQVAYNYDWEGAWLLQPSLTFIRDPWRFRIEYNWLEGRFITSPVASVGIGTVRDKDNLAFRIDYLL